MRSPGLSGTAFAVPVIDDPVAATPGVAFDRLGGEALVVRAVRAIGRLHDGVRRTGPVMVTTVVGAVTAIRHAVDRAGFTGVEVIASDGTWVGALGSVRQALADHGSAPVRIAFHDLRCPVIPLAHIHDAMALAAADPTRVVVGGGIVTDTIKRVVSGVVETTVERSELRLITSPLVIPTDVLATLVDELMGDGRPRHDLGSVVAAARDLGRLAWATSPSTVRRLTDRDSLTVAECVADALGDKAC